MWLRAETHRYFTNRPSPKPLSGLGSGKWITAQRVREGMGRQHGGFVETVSSVLAMTWGPRVAVAGLVRRVREGTGALASKALDAGKVVVFWVAVFAAVKFVLQAS